ncbi:hypothetical protein V8C86DRAFT_2750953 [Haematococcus lacustris]
MPFTESSSSRGPYPAANNGYASSSSYSNSSAGGLQGSAVQLPAASSGSEVQIFYPANAPDSGVGWQSYALVPVQYVLMQTGPPIYCSRPPGAWQLPCTGSAALHSHYSAPHSSISLPCSQPATPSQRQLSSCISASPDSASECSTFVSTTPSVSRADDKPAGGWGELTVAILQAVVSRLPDADVAQLRTVCRHWRAAVDHNLEQLTPSSLRAREVTLRFPNLRLLHLNNCTQVRNKDLEILSKSSIRLQTLTVGDDVNKPWVTNLGLAWIGKITSLTSLSLHDCVQVTNRGMGSLEHLQSLAALSLKGCARLTNSGLEALQRNTALTSLNLSGCRRVSDKGLLPLTRLPGLLHLALGNTRVADEGMEYLAQITSLHELHFAREEITDVGITRLSTLTNLQTLALRECAQVTGDALSHLVPQLFNLQSLDLFQSYEFDDQQLTKCLDFLGSLTFLDLRGTVVSEEGIQQLAKLQNLQKLCLATQHELRVEQHLCGVSHLTQLTSLAINNCQLGSFDLMAALMHLKLLRELDISNSDQALLRQHSDLGSAAVEPVNPHAIEAMAEIQSLTSIDVSRRSVKEEHLAVLAERLPQLRTLFVVGCPVLYEQLQELHRRFPELVIHRKPVHDPPLSCSSSDLGA